MYKFVFFWGGGVGGSGGGGRSVLVLAGVIQVLGSNSWKRPTVGRNYTVVANFKVRNFRAGWFAIHETDRQTAY